jgi:poly-gamma-glutamate capsule biosynthesis protein CapA/YwtB (metallophosphatase superfamily)
MTGMPTDRTRRRVLQAGAGTLVAGLAGCRLARGPADGGESRLRITLSGQALMTHTLCADPYAGLEDVVAELHRGDAVFTGLEAPVRTARSGSPTREGMFLHVAPPEVPGCLREMGFNVVALANNHAWDLGTEGILATRESVAAAGLAMAGTGRNLAQASAPGILEIAPRVALVAMATGKIAEGAAATATRAGVNEVRMTGEQLHAEDVDRNLAAIEAAASQADYVIVYLSNHQWGEDKATTKPWARSFARQCVDAGGDVFVAHGAPLLHGIELYRGRPLFHCLGSLVFHSRTPPGYYPPEVWESAIVHCDFAGGRLLGVTVAPVLLNERGDDPERHLQTRGRPRLATGVDRRRILERLSALGAALGTSLGPDGVLVLGTGA